MPADPGRPGRDDGGRDERLEDAWAQIVAGYDRPSDHPEDATPWPAAENLPPDSDDAHRPDDSGAGSGAPSGAGSGAGSGEWTHTNEEPGRHRYQAADTPDGGPGHPDQGADSPDQGADGPDQAADRADHGHWFPPPPPPLPRPVGATGVAWVGLVLGPLLLMVATVFGWQLPNLLTAGCITGFVGGLVFLIAHMDDGRHRDGWDDGAQV